MRTHLMAIVLLAGAAIAPAPSASQSASLDGDYQYVAEGSDDINRAIEQAIASMNFITRPVARSRLRKTNLPYRTLRISHTAAEVTTVPDSRDAVTSPADGSPIRWRREDGEMLTVTTRWEGESLRQTFVADDGQRVNLYSLEPDGRTLLMRVTVTSPRLPKPLTYAVRYARRS
jgi:hypothetical protein